MLLNSKNLVMAGRDVSEAKKALVMIHGRGADARDILSLSEYLNVKDFALLAPETEGNTWYPYSFLAPQKQNEPWLSSALEKLGDIIRDLNEAGIQDGNVYLLGFSQGACLTLEFAARNAKKYGGIVAFTGGLIGERIHPENYHGDFFNTPVFLGTSDPDPHVPLERVNSTLDILLRMNADVTLKVYKNMGHTISQDEISEADRLIFPTKTPPP
ncbi:MAG: alpha/beta hydrolase [Bacteroidota bacterium]|jgi:phospholipase/carboxylesterase|nr:phospholipase [Ignavibacteria bacterium]MCU7497857.1 phospholipase [Ignavibacteria bacterium]MCU7511138.1 phospholipase [Ignavibacteria bacterium]MCU7518685.1 phospholipase [Ignavibacteria bacterium]MCU7522912.1 phospholipase [Ignavibacteria bacterium]